MSTKKNVICVFSLILYLLVACTILSNWIEDQMMTQVKISERQNRGDSFGFSQSALFTDNKGDHLYEMIDGTGWSSGLRARELPSAAWYMDAHDKVQFDGSEQTYHFIISASRNPKTGDKVTVVENFEKAEDQYLCIYTDGVPEEIILPRDTEVAAQSENILLLNLKEAELPFFEQTAKGLTETLAKADTIISVTEVKQFLGALPSLALVTILLFGGIVLCFFTCLPSIGFEKNKWLIRINTIIVMAILCYIFFLLKSIELPASMLPSENILDFAFYQKKLSNIFSVLTTFPHESQAIFAVYRVAVDQLAEIIRIGIIVILCLLLSQIAICVIQSWIMHYKKCEDSYSRNRS